MSERSPYSRVYWTIRNDERLASIYPDDHHLATWLRLLLAADMAWPAPADVPASVKRASLTALVDAGVIELLPSGLFRFHGLDTERGKRREAAQASAAHRSGTEREPFGERPGTGRLASRAEPSRDEKSRATAREDDAAVAYFEVTMRVPSGRSLAWLNELATAHGEPALCAAIRATDPEPVKTFLSRVQLALTDVVVGTPSKAVSFEEFAEQQRAKASQTGVLAEIKAALEAREVSA